MSQGLDPGGNGLLVTVGGWVVAILIALFTFIAQWRRGGVDETAVVLGKWKELVETHESQITSLRQRINELEDKVTELEERGRQRESSIHELQSENRALRKQLEGERRQRQQQAVSFKEQLRLLGHNNVNGERDEPTRK